MTLLISLLLLFAWNLHDNIPALSDDWWARILICIAIGATINLLRTDKE